jgi:hypothetical protein
MAQACRFSQVLAGKPGYFAYLLSNSSVSRPRYIRGLEYASRKRNGRKYLAHQLRSENR